MNALKRLSPEQLLHVNLQLFNNTNLTTDSDLSVEMKQYYDKNLIKNAKPKLVHHQFGQKKPIPKGSGKTIEFRKYDPLPKALTALTEGVTPNGRKMRASAITATIKQFGDYIEISDMLEMTAIDNNLQEAGELLGNQAGETLDTVVREIINSGTNVVYSNNKAARYLLAGGDATWANNDYVDCEDIRIAALTLRNGKARGQNNGDFVAICHPDAVYMLKKDPEWQEAVKYQNAERIFAGEVGRYDGVRFVETTESKIFTAADLSAGARNLAITSVSGKVFTLNTLLTSADATALVGRKVIIKGYLYTVAAAVAGAAGAATLTVTENVSGSPTSADTVFPGEAGAAGRPVYSMLFIGADAYGVTELEGGGLQNIVKQMGSAGTADPLNQRATSGWKATHTAEILTDLFMVRLEHSSPFMRTAN